MKMTELQQKNEADLVQFVNEKREEVRKIRFGASGAGQRNTKAIRNLRTEIAQALTELNSRKNKAA